MTCYRPKNRLMNLARLQVSQRRLSLKLFRIISIRRTPYIERRTFETAKQLVNQPTNQPTNQPASQPTKQTTDRTTDRPAEKN